MCGIFGYVGTTQDVWETVAGALRKLEYRGYDSWGIAWTSGNRVQSRKDIGRIVGAHAIEAASPMAIGHTRWATHGGVTVANAHPHFDSSGRIALVHNGIVENVDQLRATIDDGRVLTSQTDTEVVAFLIEDEVAAGKSVFGAVRAVFPRLHGCNALVVIDQQLGELVVAKRVSPILLGHGEHGSFVTSDALALAGHTSTMLVMPDDSIARCSPGGVAVFNTVTGERIALPAENVPAVQGLWAAADGSHHMDVEMRQQPDVLRSLPGAGDESFDTLARTMAEADEIVLTGCGSALFAARIGETYIRDLLGKRATAIAASELETVLPFLTRRSLVIALSQSGETADVVDALLTVQRHNLRTAALVNVMHSTVARMVDVAVPLGAGQEQCVLATKSWFAKVGLLLKLTASAAGDAGPHGDVLHAATIVEEMLGSPALLAQVLSISERMAAADSALVVGRGLAVATAQEVALKIKEASYVHAEAFAAGELKHGAIALVSEGTPCLIVGGHDGETNEAGATAHELLSRGGYTIGIGTGSSSSFSEVIPIPSTGLATPLAQVLVAQMLAFRTALARGLDPDRPRNLAKSVTVK